MEDKEFNEMLKQWETKQAQKKAEKAAKEAKRTAELEKMQDMNTAEYIAYRSGKEYCPQGDLKNLSMKDYIKAREGKA